MKNWKTWPLHCWLAWAFHCSNITSADTASSSPIPVVKKIKNKSGQFQNWIPAHSIVPNWTKQSRLLSTWYGLGLHQVVLTKGFEHSRLLSVSRFCPINNISKLCEHLGLKNKRSPIIIAYYIYMYIQGARNTHLILSRHLGSTMTDWPQRGWRHRTRPLLPLCCQHTPPPPSSTWCPAPASLACKLPLLLSNRRETER